MLVLHVSSNIQNLVAVYSYTDPIMHMSSELFIIWLGHY